MTDNPPESTLDKYHPRASEYLTYSGDYNEIDKGVREFMLCLCDLEDDLVELEADVSKHELDATGWRASKTLSALETRQLSLAEEIRETHSAIVKGKANRLDRNPGEDWHHRSQQHLYRHQDDFMKIHQRLEEVSARIGQRIDAKRNTANTRLVITVSLCAVVISILSLVVSLIYQ
ncbi:hypothetical protein DM826_07375 [Halonotius aquaticus]|uniref:Uncharacterized protein n=1 Tax=Halonotius aquaticus TaxID=2216978 RepID=A0A3A6PXY4_9EURY|nr:hypothetical protein [Halonotius aquaticus]RJX43119.1 hypothetical protein DM826_07375 [Halonotius aquaticus]